MDGVFHKHALLSGGQIYDAIEAYRFPKSLQLAFIEDIEAANFPNLGFIASGDDLQNHAQGHDFSLGLSMVSHRVVSQFHTIQPFHHLC